MIRLRGAELSRNRTRIKIDVGLNSDLTTYETPSSRLFETQHKGNDTLEIEQERPETAAQGNETKQSRPRPSSIVIWAGRLLVSRDEHSWPVPDNGEPVRREKNDRVEDMGGRSRDQARAPQKCRY